MRENERKSAYTQSGRPSVRGGLGFGLYLGSIQLALRKREVLYKYPFVPLQPFFSTGATNLDFSYFESHVFQPSGLKNR